MGNLRILYGAGSPTAAARELARYKLDLVGVQEVRWDKWGTVTARIIFFYGKGKENHQFGIKFFVQKRKVSAVKGEEFISNSIGKIVLRSRWWNIIVLNVYEPSEEKSYDAKESFTRI